MRWQIRLTINFGHSDCSLVAGVRYHLLVHSSVRVEVTPRLKALNWGWTFLQQFFFRRRPLAPRWIDQLTVHLARWVVIWKIPVHYPYQWLSIISAYPTSDSNQLSRTGWMNGWNWSLHWYEGIRFLDQICQSTTELALTWVKIDDDLSIVVSIVWWAEFTCAVTWFTARTESQYKVTGKWATEGSLDSHHFCIFTFHLNHRFNVHSYGTAFSDISRKFRANSSVLSDLNTQIIRLIKLINLIQHHWTMSLSMAVKIRQTYNRN